jgi:hypothetical protein
MPVALTFQIVFWRRLDSADPETGLQFPLWPSENTSPGIMLFWLFMVGMIPLWLRESPSDNDLSLGDPDISGDSASGEHEVDQGDSAEGSELGEAAALKLEHGEANAEADIEEAAGCAHLNEVQSDAGEPTDELGSGDAEEFNERPRL